MRTYFAFLFVALCAFAFSSPAFAGKYEEDCGVFRGEKRLYGLCIAYQNALYHEDEEAMADIFANWQKWVDENGEPQLPNHPYDDGEEPECPCWTADDLEKWTAGLGGVYCVSAADFDRIAYNNDFRPDLYAGVKRLTTADYECSVSLSTGGLIFAATFEESEICRAGLEVLRASTWDDDGDPNTDEVPVFETCIEF